MSAADAVDRLISTLRGISASTRDEATALVHQAGTVFDRVNPPRLDPIQFDVERTDPDNEVAVTPVVAWADIKSAKLPEEINFTDITPFDERFTAHPPEINLPSPVQTRLPLLPNVTATLPRIKPLTVEVDFNSAESPPPTPTLTLPQSFLVNPLSGDAPDVPAPHFDAFDRSFFDEYKKGLQLSMPDTQEFSAWVKKVYAGTVDRLDSQWTAKMQSVLQSGLPAVPAEWGTRKATQAAQDIRSERFTALTDLDDIPSAQTGLPTGQRLWSRMKLELGTLQATIKAASKVAMEQRAREAQHMQWALQLCAQWVEAAIALKAQEGGWRMKGWLLTLEGATHALALSLRVLEGKEQELQFYLRYNEIQSRRAELRFKKEQTKLSELKSALASNQLLGTFNQHQQQVYDGALALLEQSAKKYQVEMEYLSTQKQLEKLKLQLYEAQVKKFEAEVNAFAAEQQALAARVKGDSARVDGELAKVRRFQAQVKAFEAETAGRSTEASARAAYNRALLEEYTEKLDAKIAEFRAFDPVVQLAVSALLQEQDATIGAKTLTLQAQDQADRVAMDTALREMQRAHTDTLLEIEKHGLRFAQRQAEGQIIAQGAGTVGSMATQAFSSLNAVGAQEILENA